MNNLLNLFLDDGSNYSVFRERYPVSDKLKTCFAH